MIAVSDELGDLTIWKNGTPGGPPCPFGSLRPRASYVAAMEVARLPGLI